MGSLGTLRVYSRLVVSMVRRGIHKTDNIDRGRKWTNIQSNAKSSSKVSTPMTKYTPVKATNLPVKAINNLKRAIDRLFPDLKVGLFFPHTALPSTHTISHYHRLHHPKSKALCKLTIRRSESQEPECAGTPTLSTIPS